MNRMIALNNQRSVFQSVKNSVDKPKCEEINKPISLPNTGNNKASTMIKTIAIVKKIAINLEAKNDLVSSTSYALLNARTIELIPLDADQSVAITPNDNKPPFFFSMIWFNDSSIIATDSPGANSLIVPSTSSCVSGKYAINVIRKSKNGNRDNKKKYASCADNPATSSCKNRFNSSLKNDKIYPPLDYCRLWNKFVLCFL